MADHHINGRIPLIVAQQTAYVWDVDDIATLRSEHRICGILSGTLPRLSQQNVFLGVPLVLMPEEVVYLLEKDVVVLVDESNAYPPFDLDGLQKWISDQEDAFSRQRTLAHSKDDTVKGYTTSEEVKKKRQEREEKRRGEQIPSPSSRNPSSTHTIVIPTSSTSLPWYQPAKDHCLFSSIESAIAAGIWKFPSNALEWGRYNIFRDLHEKGYFIAGGIKFGGQYLVYPGDPLRYHSHFIATIHESVSSIFRPMEVVAHGRLGTATKKTHLLCGWDDERKEASYLSVEWGRFG